MASARVARELRLPPLPTIKDIIRMYRLRALKQLSQNFLMDMRLTDKIVKSAGNITNGQVCEVGPGPGAITRSILNRGPNRLVVIEKDRRFIPALELLTEAYGSRMEVIIGDATNFNMEKMFEEESRRPWDDSPPNVHLIGNLPFSVSTHLVIQWLQAIAEKQSAWTYGRTRMTLTFQKEVAERMVAGPRSMQRCRLSVMCQNWCEVNHRFTIPGSAFVPKPDVDVGVVQFTPLVTPKIQLPFKLIEKVVRCIFSHRQKYSIRGAGITESQIKYLATCVNLILICYKTLFPKCNRKPLTDEMYRLADVNPMRRPFELGLSEFGRLCLGYRDVCQRDPRLFEYNHRASKEEIENFETDMEQNDPEGVVTVKSVQAV